MFATFTVLAPMHRGKIFFVVKQGNNSVKTGVLCWVQPKVQCKTWDGQDVARVAQGFGTPPGGLPSAGLVWAECISFPVFFSNFPFTLSLYFYFSIYLFYLLLLFFSFCWWLLLQSTVEGRNPIHFELLGCKQLIVFI